jgi:hypothetical protein
MTRSVWIFRSGRFCSAFFSSNELALQLLGQMQRKWVFQMLVAAITAAFIVFALFLSMLGSSPKDDPEWNADTEA